MSTAHFEEMKREKMKEKMLPLETRLKLVDVAIDVLDRDGSTTGSFHRVEMTHPNCAGACLVGRGYVFSSLQSGWKETGNVAHYALGAIEQAMVEQGLVDSLAENDALSLERVQELMGFGGDEAAEVWNHNDRDRDPKGALDVARRIIRRH